MNQWFDQLAVACTDFMTWGMLNGTCYSEAIKNSWWAGFFSLLTSRTAQTDFNDGSLDVTTQESDTTLTVLEESIPDKEINKEIVDDPNVLAKVNKVKLPAHICKFKLLPCSSITQPFTQIEGGLYLMLHVYFSNQSFQC